MLAYRVREHKETGQTIKIKNIHNELSCFEKSQYEKQCFARLIIAALKSCSVYSLIVHYPRSIFQNRIVKIPHEFPVYVSPQTKRGYTSKGRYDFQGSSVSNALLYGFKNCAGY